MPELSKLQIRAKVLSVVAEIKSCTDFNEDLLEHFINELLSVEDKNTLLSVFLKEYIKMDELCCTFSACLLKETVPVQIIAEKAMEYIKNPNLSDELKYKFVQLMRIAGVSCDFNEIPQYFDKPAEVLDLETKKLLEKAVFNPESMLDFLDFVSAVSSKDRNVLLQSLAVDYQGNMLANIVYPILYSDFDDDFVLSAIEILADSKSSLAIEPFNYLMETSSNPEIINACKTGLKKLKLAGASKEKAEEYFKEAVKGSVPAEFYTTIPDGNSNQAFIISRKTAQNKFLLMAVVINDERGIVDTFGFYNISSEELIKVVARFYKSEGRYPVPPEYAKTRIIEAINKTIQLKKKFPYEFICWYPLLSDVGTLAASVQEIADAILKEEEFSKDEICSVLTKEHTFRWFISSADNIKIKELFDEFYNLEKPDIRNLNEQIKKSVPVIFDEETEQIWVSKLYNLIYLLYLAREKDDCRKYYSIIKNKEFFNLFKTILLQRSIFNYAVGVFEKMRESSFPVNIFKRKNVKENEYEIKKLESVINYLKEKWLD